MRWINTKRQELLNRGGWFKHQYEETSLRNLIDITNFLKVPVTGVHLFLSALFLSVPAADSPSTGSLQLWPVTCIFVIWSSSSRQCLEKCRSLPLSRFLSRRIMGISETWEGSWNNNNKSEISNEQETPLSIRCAAIEFNLQGK